MRSLKDVHASLAVVCRQMFAAFLFSADFDQRS